MTYNVFYTFSVSQLGLQLKLFHIKLFQSSIDDDNNNNKKRLLIAPFRVMEYDYLHV